MPPIDDPIRSKCSLSHVSHLTSRSLELDLRAEFDDPIGRNTEVLRGRARIPSHDGKNSLPPTRHAAAPDRNELLAAQVVRGFHASRSHAGLDAPGPDFLDVRRLHEPR